MNHRPPTNRDLLVFGLLLPAFFALVGSTIGHRAGSEAATQVVWAAGAGLVAVYWLARPTRAPIFNAAVRVTYPIGWVVSHVLLLGVFVATVCPIALLLRLFRHDPLERRFDRSKASYWVERDPRVKPARYFRHY